MLACNADISKIKYPVLATPKLDGIRCIIKNGKCISRNLKDIPNNYIRELLINTIGNDYYGNSRIIFDGEIICGNFNTTSSSVMRKTGTPIFTYHIFDAITFNNYNLLYEDRINFLKEWFCVFKLRNNKEFISIVEPYCISDFDELQKYEQRCINLGYEGICIRAIDSPYKFGRSTVKEGYLLKIKRFEDSEAEIIDFEELMHNNNEKLTDALGYTDRSTCKENMIPMEMLGSLKVRDIKTRIEFSLGSGFDLNTRKEIWNNKNNYIGKLVKYKYQPSGKKDLPRFPTFIGIRDENDL